MKSKNILSLGMVSLLASGMLITSCKKSFDDRTVRNSDFSNSSLVQLYMAMPNATRNYVYMDGKALTGIAMTSGSVFPSVAYAFNVPGGLRAFTVRDTLTTSTQLPLNFAQDMKVGTNYTIFMYDTITSPRQKTVETKIEIPTDSTARLRFANFVYNPTALPSGFDIFSVKRNANIFTNVQLTDVTDFIPYATGITDTFYIRLTGTGTNLQNWRTTPAPATWVDIMAVLNPAAKRSYTLIFRGGYRATTTTATTVRTLSTFTNY